MVPMIRQELQAIAADGFSVAHMILVMF